MVGPGPAPAGVAPSCAPSAPPPSRCPPCPLPSDLSAHPLLHPGHRRGSGGGQAEAERLRPGVGAQPRWRGRCAAGTPVAGGADRSGDRVRRIPVEGKTASGKAAKAVSYTFFGIQVAVKAFYRDLRAAPAPGRRRARPPSRACKTNGPSGNGSPPSSTRPCRCSSTASGISIRERQRRAGVRDLVRGDRGQRGHRGRGDGGSRRRGQPPVGRQELRAGHHALPGRARLQQRPHPGRPLRPPGVDLVHRPPSPP